MHTLEDQRPCGGRHARGRPWIAGLLGSLPVVAAMMVFLATFRPVQAAVFQCPAGDVACLITAITTANGNGEDDTITLAAGTYTLTAVDNTTHGQNGLPSITSPITIQGAGADTTIIARDANAPFFRLLHVSAEGVLQLEGLTVRGGWADSGPEPQPFGDDGGGMLNFGDVRITHSRLTDNSAEEGGGVANHGGAVTIAHAVVADNSALEGGGVANHGGAVTIADVVVADNSADRGGGLASTEGTVQITEASFLDNLAGQVHGGGLSNCGGSVTIATTTLARNNGDSATVGNGGFGECDEPTASTMTLVHTTIADSAHTALANSGTMVVLNSAIVRNGVGLCCANISNDGMLVVINTTIAANMSPIGNSGDGSLTLINTTVADNGEACCFGGPALFNNGGTAVLSNTIVARNVVDHDSPGGPDCEGPIISQGHNLIGDPTGCTITLQPSDLTGDPGLGRLLDDGTPGQAHLPLLATSRTINAGDNAVCTEDPRLATDQLGNPRVGPCDIGAIEFRPESVPVNDVVAFEPIPSTFAFTPDPTGCPSIYFAGKFRFEARLTNSRESPLTDLVVAVTALTNENLLQNADSGPGGVGTNVTVPQQDGFADGILSPEEFVDVPFVICLTQQQPFTFVVDVLGVVKAGAAAQARAPLAR